MTLEVQKFQLSDIKGLVCTTQNVTIPRFSTINIWANTSVKGHCMHVHVLTELVLGPQLPAAVVLPATYGELHPGSSPQHPGEHPRQNFLVDSWAVKGVDQRIFGPIATPLTMKNSPKVILVEE